MFLVTKKKKRFLGVIVLKVMFLQEFLQRFQWGGKKGFLKMSLGYWKVPVVETSLNVWSSWKGSLGFLKVSVVVLRLLKKILSSWKLPVVEMHKIVEFLKRLLKKFLWRVKVHTVLTRVLERISEVGNDPRLLRCWNKLKFLKRPWVPEKIVKF